MRLQTRHNKCWNRPIGFRKTFGSLQLIPRARQLEAVQPALIFASIILRLKSICFHRRMRSRCMMSCSLQGNLQVVSRGFKFILLCNVHLHMPRYQRRQIPGQARPSLGNPPHHEWKGFLILTSRRGRTSRHTRLRVYDDQDTFNCKDFCLRTQVQYQNNARRFCLSMSRLGDQPRRKASNQFGAHALKPGSCSGRLSTK
jgi:hypothetical protein